MSVPSRSVHAGQEAGEPLSPLDAVLWDMDGTLMDSEPYWLDAEKELVLEHGGIWHPSMAEEMIGMPLSVSAEQLRSRAGVGGSVEEIVNTLLARVSARIAAEGVPWQPGAAALLQELRADRVPCALVTMSYTPLAEVLLAAVPSETFATVITGDSVQQGKPHPEPYLTAMADLEVEARNCVAIEDSVPGLTAAQASGACAIGVPALVPLPSAPGRTILDSLDGVTVADLRRILTTWQSTP